MENKLNILDIYNCCNDYNKCDDSSEQTNGNTYQKEEIEKTYKIIDLKPMIQDKDLSLTYYTSENDLGIDFGNNLNNHTDTAVEFNYDDNTHQCVRKKSVSSSEDTLNSVNGLNCNFDEFSKENSSKPVKVKTLLFKLSERPVIKSDSKHEIHSELDSQILKNSSLLKCQNDTKKLSDNVLIKSDLLITSEDDAHYLQKDCCKIDFRSYQVLEDENLKVNNVYEQSDTENLDPVSTSNSEILNNLNICEKSDSQFFIRDMNCNSIKREKTFEINYPNPNKRNKFDFENKLDQQNVSSSTLYNSDKKEIITGLNFKENLEETNKLKNELGSSNNEETKLENKSSLIQNLNTNIIKKYSDLDYNIKLEPENNIEEIIESTLSPNVENKSFITRDFQINDFKDSGKVISSKTDQLLISHSVADQNPNSVNTNHYSEINNKNHKKENDSKLSSDTENGFLRSNSELSKNFNHLHANEMCSSNYNLEFNHPNLNFDKNTSKNFYLKEIGFKENTDLRNYILKTNKIFDVVKHEVQKIPYSHSQTISSLKILNCNDGAMSSNESKVLNKREEISPSKLGDTKLINICSIPSADLISKHNLFLENNCKTENSLDKILPLNKNENLSNLLHLKQEKCQETIPNEDCNFNNKAISITNYVKNNNNNNLNIPGKDLIDKKESNSKTNTAIYSSLKNTRDKFSPNKHNPIRIFKLAIDSMKSSDNNSSNSSNSKSVSPEPNEKNEDSEKKKESKTDTVVKDYFEDEKDDLLNPDWQAVKNLSTNEERYHQVRKHWGSRKIPDPNRNLSYHSYRKRLFNSSFLEPRTVKQHKRHATSDLNEKRAKRSCTYFIDKKIDSIYKIKDEKKQEIIKEMHFKITAVENSFQQNKYNSSKNSRMFNQLGNRVSVIENEYNNMADSYEMSVRGQINLLNERRNEVLKFFRFYKGLNVSNEDPTYLTEAEFQELEEIEKVYKQFDNYYHD